MFYNLFRPKWISVQGTTFKCGCVLWIKNDDEEMPVFSVLKDICMVQKNVNDVWLVTEGLLTTIFNRHLNSYEVNETNSMMLVKQQHLLYSMPLHLIKVVHEGQVKTHVCPKYQVPTV